MYVANAPHQGCCGDHRERAAHPGSLVWNLATSRPLRGCESCCSRRGSPTGVDRLTTRLYCAAWEPDNAETSLLGRGKVRPPPSSPTSTRLHPACVGEIDPHHE